MTGRFLSIPLGHIITSPRLQNRNANAPCLQHRLPTTPATLDHLGSLKHAIKRGAEIPPVRVIEAEDDKPGRFYLVDGYHRLWAYQGLNLKEIPATVLDGQGFAAALVEAGRANHSHGLLLTKDQKVENAWRCLNLQEADYYRRLNKTRAEAELGIDRETIKKMRQKVRQWGIQAGAIDPALRGKEAEEALLAYWNDNLAPDTWRMARRDGTAERKDPAWQEKKIARALAQVLVDFEAVFGAEVAKKAFGAVGYHLHNTKPADGMGRVRRSFSVHPQPRPSDDEVILSGDELEGFLEWQRQQPFDTPAPTYFNDKDHQLPSDF